MHADIASFTLPNLTVQRGKSIVWTNRDTAGHSATSGSSPEPDGRWDTGHLAPGGASAPKLMNTAGSFPYFCFIHTGMTATVTVTQ